MTARRKSKVGGKRAGAGRPSLGSAGRTVVKTIKLSQAEVDAQVAGIGDTKWATWAHDTLVAVHPPSDE